MNTKVAIRLARDHSAKTGFCTMIEEVVAFYPKHEIDTPYRLEYKFVNFSSDKDCNIEYFKTFDEMKRFIEARLANPPLA